MICIYPLKRKDILELWYIIMSRGWRFIGLAATIILYVIGILVLSLVNLQTSKMERRPRNTRFITELDSQHNPEINMLRRTPLQLRWCSELHFQGRKGMMTGPFKLRRIESLETFPGHKIKSDNFIIEGSHVMLKSSDKKSKPNLVRSSESDINEFNRSNDVRTRSAIVNKNEKLANALASFPGSGNTWLRYLLQQATGVLTGSVYKDFGLLKSGFPAESISNTSVLLVKTHEWGEGTWSQFGRAVLLIRDPAKAILAEFNRQSGGHVGFASPDRYRRTKGKYWMKFVMTKLHAWEQTNLSWGKNFSGPLLIVYYEDLVDDVEKVVRDILNFIQFPIDEDLMRCALSRKEGIYRRKRRLLTFDPFTPAMKKLIEEARVHVYTELGRNAKPK